MDWIEENYILCHFLSSTVYFYLKMLVYKN
jgi:hypothetical protein